MRQFVVLLFISLLILNGCSQEDEVISADPSVVDYEYLSTNEQYSDEIERWLRNAINSEDERIHSLSSSDDDNVYFYAKAHKRAKVSYLYENKEDIINKSLKITLLKGNKSEDVFIKVSYDSGLCCDNVITDVVDQESEF
ncbi:hypothetical protein ACTWQB_04780 [Piscibacillus sp. B03]|uniref:hypothetical protein n=1 Tax=Piscibacillus sp. B03 TaxID=3457430 RepID=UPI003FCEA13F